jgi:hypothetical protein
MPVVRSLPSVVGLYAIYSLGSSNHIDPKASRFLLESYNANASSTCTEYRKNPCTIKKTESTSFSSSHRASQQILHKLLPLLLAVGLASPLSLELNLGQPRLAAH